MPDNNTCENEDDSFFNVNTSPGTAWIRTNYKINIRTKSLVIPHWPMQQQIHEMTAEGDISYDNNYGCGKRKPK